MSVLGWNTDLKLLNLGVCVEVSLKGSLNSGHTRISALLLARSDHGLQDRSLFNTIEKEGNSIIRKWKLLQTEYNINHKALSGM